MAPLAAPPVPAPTPAVSAVTLSATTPDWTGIEGATLLGREESADLDLPIGAQLLQTALFGSDLVYGAVDGSHIGLVCAHLLAEGEAQFLKIGPQIDGLDLELVA